MPLNVGTRLAHYDVTALIGEGGMGQVYQATDTTFNRDVALKVLPDAFTADPARLARFEREAKVLASLNHPNIGAIYGLEKSGDTRALVLELIEGPTLADRIAQGPIPVDEALPIAKQIAEALEAAHEAGVIHRDLKPANIKVREDGTVKVLDFGLAKALDTTPEGDPSQSPTLTAAATQMGVIMGTAAYMSPEQARGKPVDRRADIWAFGCVLFEMLTGLRPFQGEDVSLTLAAVMTFEPDLALLPETLSPTLKTYLIRCLAKDPKERLRDIGDVRLAMKGAFETPASAPSVGTATPQPSVWQRPVPLLLGAGLLVAISGLAVWSVTRSGPPTVQPTKRFVITQPASNAIAQGFPGHHVALSPDGRTLVYVGANDGVRQLFRRSMDQLEVIPLRDTENAIAPSFSLNGEWVTFIAGLGGPLVKVSLAGGSALTIMQHPDARARTWGPDDTIVFGTFGSGLSRVSANAGDPEPLTTPAEEGESHREPHFLPDVGALLFVVRSQSGDGDQLAVYSFETGEWHELSLEGARPHYSLGHIMFSREDALWAVPFEVDRLALTGDAFLVLEGVTSSGATQFDVARDGTLVYVPEGTLGAGDARTLTWVDREGISTPLKEERLPYRNPRFSPDGRRLLLQIRDEGASHIWVQDVERGTLTPLTFEGAFNGLPIWSPDGTYVTFSVPSGDGRNPSPSGEEKSVVGVVACGGIDTERTRKPISKSTWSGSRSIGSACWLGRWPFVCAI